MTSISRIRMRGPGQRGFTLVEALVAFAILVLATVGMVWSRSHSVQQAAEYRNLRLAVKIAMETLDHLQAGMNENDIYELNDWMPQEKYDEYSVRIVTGDEHISEFEEELASSIDDEDALHQLDLEERLRDEQETRAAEEGSEPLLDPMEEDEPTIDEETFQEVLVAVRYPTFNYEKFPNGLGVYVLRASLTTLAISGKTPEQAEDDQAANAGAGAGAGGAGGGSGGDR